MRLLSALVLTIFVVPSVGQTAVKPRSCANAIVAVYISGQAVGKARMKLDELKSQLIDSEIRQDDVKLSIATREQLSAEFAASKAMATAREICHLASESN